MPRNGSGVFSLPGTYLATTGETIQAQQHNDPLEDLESDANTARPIVAGGTGATTAADARTALDVPGLSSDNTFSGANTFSGTVSGVIPAGSVIPFAGSSAPTGWLLADGSAVSRTTYSALFAVIGTTFGSGNGSTTFNLPDLGGRTVAGKEASASRLTSAGGGVDGGTLGAAGGAQTKTLAAGNIPQVTSTETPMTSLNTTAVGSGSSVTVLSGTQTQATIHSGSASPSAFGVVQPTIVLNYIIKT